MTATLSAATRVVASRNNVSTTLSGEAIILGMDDGVYYGLDPVGTRIWDLVQVPRTLGEVSTTLATEYDVSAGQALADLVTLVSDLQARGLLIIVADEAP